MLSELEIELIGAVNASPIAANLRDVAAMPDGDGKTLVKRFLSAAPAVYVVAGPVKFTGDVANIEFALFCLARNARGNDAARRGDGQTIGLYQILDTLAAWLDSHSTTSAVWSADSIAFSKAQIWADNGLSVGSLQVSTQVTGPALLDPTALDDFITFHADYDIDPHQSQVDHLKWAEEPPNYTVSAPELSETLTLIPMD